MGMRGWIMVDFSIDVRDLKGIPGSALVTARGSIDFTTAHRFRAEVDAARARGIRRFIMDMDGVTYINSGGLSTLIGLAGADAPETPPLLLLRVPPKIRVLIDLLKLGSAFRFCQTLEEAAEILEKPSSSSNRAVAIPSEDSADHR